MPNHISLFYTLFAFELTRFLGMGEDLIILRHPKYTLFACEIPGVRMGEDLIILRHPKYILGHDLYLAHDYKDKQIATTLH